MEYHSALQRNEILTCATTPMNLKDMMLTEIRQTQLDTKDKHSPIPLPWGAQNMQIHRNWEVELEVSYQGWGKGGLESYCLMGRDFQFKMTALEMPSGDGCITVWIH